MGGGAYCGSSAPECASIALEHSFITPECGSIDPEYIYMTPECSFIAPEWVPSPLSMVPAPLNLVLAPLNTVPSEPGFSAYGYGSSAPEPGFPSAPIIEIKLSLDTALNLFTEFQNSNFPVQYSSPEEEGGRGGRGEEGIVKTHREGKKDDRNTKKRFYFFTKRGEGVMVPSNHYLKKLFLCVFPNNNT